MKIVGIDPATSKVGIAAIKITRGGRVKLVEVDEIRAPKKNLGARLEYIYNNIGPFLKKHKPKYVGIENQFMRANPKSYRLVCYSVGVAWGSIVSNTEADVYIIEATRWRSLVLGEGKSSKKDAIDFVCNKFDLSPKLITDNMAEAVGLAIATHEETLNGTKPT